MKYFVTSDPHGHHTELVKALEDAGFDRTNDEHHLIIAGDLFDRGKENLKVLQYVSSLLDEDKITLIRGNHDEFFYDVKSFGWNYTYNGFNTTIDEFFKGELSTNEPYQILKKVLSETPKLEKVLNSMLTSLKIGNYVITHGGFDSLGVPNNWNNTERWIRNGTYDDDGNIYIFGHWGAYKLNEKFLNKEMDNKPFIYKNYIGLDSTVSLFKEMFVYIIES